MICWWDKKCGQTLTAKKMSLYPNTAGTKLRPLARIDLSRFQFESLDALKVVDTEPG